MGKRICLITGANSGIGRAAASQMAERGWHVILACRNRQKGEKALNEIKGEIHSGTVELMIVDMSLQSSIREFAEDFLMKYDTLDVLIHNAAEFDTGRKLPVMTKEGIENIWAANHIGPVLLTELLLEPLKRSTQGRVITIASKGLITFPFLKVNLEDPEFRRRKFSVVKAYYQSKLAQVMYTYWLSNRLANSGITANCIRVTNVKVDISRYPDISGISRYLYSIKSKFSITAGKMAETYVWLADSEDAGGLSGKYIDEGNHCVKSSKYSYDPHNVEKLMEVTLKYIER